MLAEQEQRDSAARREFGSKRAAVVVTNSADENAYLPALMSAGYELRVREPDFHEHRMFRTPELDVHIHVLSRRSPEIERHLTFASDQLFESTPVQIFHYQEDDAVFSFPKIGNTNRVRMRNPRGRFGFARKALHHDIVAG